MAQWEYQEINLPITDDTSEELAESGKAGWEAYAVIYRPPIYGPKHKGPRRAVAWVTIYMKRPRES